MYEYCIGNIISCTILTPITDWIVLWEHWGCHMDTRHPLLERCPGSTDTPPIGGCRVSIIDTFMAPPMYKKIILIDLCSCFQVLYKKNNPYRFLWLFSSPNKGDEFLWPYNSFIKFFWQNKIFLCSHFFTYYVAKL